MSIHDLFDEGRRQLAVCNSCRYCEGLCPVWPALELRTALTDGDITHLANLCHDCRDCFSSCMYTAPHEFALNPPKLFSDIRVRTYADYAWPWNGKVLLRWQVLLVTLLAVAALLTGLSRWVGGQAHVARGSIYALLPYELILVVVLLPTVLAVGAVAVAALRYWRDVHGSPAGLLNVRVWARSMWAGVALLHMRGGGAGCEAGPDEPSSQRRRAHLTLTIGFGLCLVSTIAAGIMQDFLHRPPPYAWYSLPVVSGTLGGVGLIVGCGWLVRVKVRADPNLAGATMRRADYGLLWALIVLAASGLATLLVRDTVAAKPVLVVHLACVVVAFGIAPYTKFPHFVFRLLAIYKAELDRTGLRQR